MAARFAQSEKPVIGIVCRLLVDQDPAGSPWAGNRKYANNLDYCAAVEAAGGIPVLLPWLADANDDQVLLNHLHGLVFAGGQDVDPQLYGQTPKPLLGAVDRAQDVFEIRLAQLASELDLPVLGICRGQQLLNVAFGGTLVQDLAYAGFTVVQHKQTVRPEIVTHTITTVPETWLAGIYGSRHQTNSFHHQIIDRLAPGMRVTARTEDGVIEGIELPDRRFFQAVQFHPERMFRSDPASLNLFRGLVEAAKAL